MKRSVLGVDPGAGGAFALITERPDIVVLWGAWTTLARKEGSRVRLTISQGGRVVMRSMLSACLRAIEEELLLCTPHYDLVIEGLFAPRRRRGQRPVNPQSVVPLAISSGEIRAALERVPVAEPLASEWRWSQLSLPARTKAGAAELAAVRLAPHAFNWAPSGGSPVDAGLTKGELGAVSEAAFIARHGWQLVNGHNL